MSGAVYDERPTVKSKVDRGDMVVTIPLPVPSPDEKMGGRLASKNSKSTGNKILICILGIYIVVFKFRLIIYSLFNNFSQLTIIIK